MEYKKFTEDLQERVKEIIKINFGEGTKVSFNSITKNNSVKLDGFTIIEKDMNISPTIYINDYYVEYEMGRTIESIADSIIAVYEENKMTVPVDLKFFTEFEKIKEKIVFKLINYEKNHKLLQEIPHIQFLDLAIVFYCLVSSNEMGNATILIHNHHMKMWDTNINELYSISKENTPAVLGCKLRNMDEIMREILLEDLSQGNDEMKNFLEPLLEIPSEKTEKGHIPMYVLSNSSKINGAACLLYQKVLEEFSNKIKKDFYILPSSIHEVIIVPVSNDYSKNELVEMVKEVNQTQVQEEEILSDSVYYYSKIDGKITM